MPRSKGRRRKPSRPSRALAGPPAPRGAERKKITLAQYRFRRSVGWSMVGIAVLVGVTHWFTHLGMWGFASSGVEDLVAGYPMALVLGIGGSMVLSKA